MEWRIDGCFGETGYVITQMVYDSSCCPSNGIDYTVNEDMTIGSFCAIFGVPTWSIEALT